MAFAHTPGSTHRTIRVATSFASSLRLDEAMEDDGIFGACDYAESAGLAAVGVWCVSSEVAVRSNFDPFETRQLRFVPRLDGADFEYVFWAHIDAVVFAFALAVVDDWLPGAGCGRASFAWAIW